MNFRERLNNAKLDFVIFLTSGLLCYTGINEARKNISIAYLYLDKMSSSGNNETVINLLQNHIHLAEVFKHAADAAIVVTAAAGLIGLYNYAKSRNSI